MFRRRFLVVVSFVVTGVVGLPTDVVAADSFTWQQIEYRPWSADDATTPDVTEVFADATITVTTAGQTTGSGSAAWSGEAWPGFTSVTGSSELSLSGSFDAATGDIDGTFTITTSSTAVSGQWDLAQEWSMSTTGTFFRHRAHERAGVVMLEFRGSETMTGQVEQTTRIDCVADACEVTTEFVPMSSQRDVTYRVDLFDGVPCFGEPIDSGARLASISREVEIFPSADIDAVRSGKMDGVLNVCDHVVTGEESSAIISFSDLSTLMMGPESEVIILSPPETPTRLETLVGTMIMNAEKVLRGENIEVKNRLSALGIKGTTFVVEVTDDDVLVKVIEGEVEVTSLVLGEAVTLVTGEQVAATGASDDVVSAFDPVAEFAAWEAPFELELEPDDAAGAAVDTGAGSGDVADEGAIVPISTAGQDDTGDGGTSTAVMLLIISACVVAASSAGLLLLRSRDRRTAAG